MVLQRVIVVRLSSVIHEKLLAQCPAFNKSLIITDYYYIFYEKDYLAEVVIFQEDCLLNNSFKRTASMGGSLH